MTKLYNAIGLMSGTSADGVDLSYIRSDGFYEIQNYGNSFYQYSKQFQQNLQFIIKSNPTLLDIKLFENELTKIHGNCVNQFLDDNKINASEIDVIGFHGHTILHKPLQQITWQIGNVDMLAKLTSIKVIKNFRTYDIAHGGQGAPLAPIYHFYLVKDKSKPVLILNIGGIANITYLENNNEDSIQAFDICFGNSISDELVKKNLDINYDNNGEIALSGTINFKIAKEILELDIFHKKPIKSYDKLDFDNIINLLNNLEINDALATLSYIIAKVLEINISKFLPQKPHKIIIAGGGRKNKAIINQIKNLTKDSLVLDADEIGLNGDYIEAEAFAFLAIRRMQRLNNSFEKTTGISTTGISNCN